MMASATSTTTTNSLAWEVQWSDLMSHGQAMVEQQRWDSAAVFYKQAYELAESKFCGNCSNQHCIKNTFGRYLSSAKEFAGIMAKNEYHCALEVFVETLQVQIDNVSNQHTDLGFQHTLNEVKDLINVTH